MSKPTLRRDWWSKTSAGVFGGFGLAVALSGLFAWIGPGGLAAPNKFQFTMWITAPIFLAVLSLVFLFSSGRRAWLALGSLNVLAFCALGACRHYLT